MNALPDIITHNFHPHFGPCPNICDLDDSAAEEVLERIRQAGGRTLKPDYLKRRRATEEWLIQERRRKLGETPLHRPLYFFLGDFADGRDPSRPASLALHLNNIPPESLTFTFPDSMASFEHAGPAMLEAPRPPFHGQVLSLPEIVRAVSMPGLPCCFNSRDPARRVDQFVEVQIWDDAPILSQLEARVRNPSG